ncbi:MAG: TspO/MBR family protein [Candidatus Uhrbacteria bacterium]
MKIKKVFQLILAIIIAESAGVIGSVFTVGAIPVWYSTLNKPSFNPPNWLFGPVWTILFVLMGIAAFLIWQRGWKKLEVKNALKIFLSQLILNTLWSILFFGLHSPTAAFLEIIALWLLILATIISFWKISRPAAYLLFPYILWVTFAAFLNLTIVFLN